MRLQTSHLRKVNRKMGIPVAFKDNVIYFTTASVMATSSKMDLSGTPLLIMTSIMLCISAILLSSGFASTSLSSEILDASENCPTTGMLLVFFWYPCTTY